MEEKILQEDAVFIVHAVKADIHYSFFSEWITAIRCFIIKLLDVEI